MKQFHLHLVSDSTGETVDTVARASMVQMRDIKPTEHVWNMVRNRRQVEEAIAGIELNPGFVLYTLVNPEMRMMLEEGCKRLQLPCISVLDPVVAAIASYSGSRIEPQPGRQYVMDADYFNRIEAIHFVLSHDDGQSAATLGNADVVVVGVSRTSKTPTCIYLANRGIKAANVPIVPGCALPGELTASSGPLVVGLTKDPKQLVQIRRNRLKALKQDEVTDYVDQETVIAEVHHARRLFSQQDWPVIDATRRSIEEVAATILHLYNRRQENQL